VGAGVVGVGLFDYLTDGDQEAGGELVVGALAELNDVAGGAADQLGADPLLVGALGHGDLLDADVGVEGLVVLDEHIDRLADAALQLPVGKASDLDALVAGGAFAAEDADERDG